MKKLVNNYEPLFEVVEDESGMFWLKVSKVLQAPSPPYYDTATYQTIGQIKLEPIKNEGE